MDPSKTIRASFNWNARAFEICITCVIAALNLMTVGGKLSGVLNDAYNWTAAVASGVSATLHVGALAYRCVFPDTFWIPVLVGWLDCLLLTLTHVEVQLALWDSLHGPLALGFRPCMVDHVIGCKETASIQVTLLLCSLISFMTNFLLSFPQGVIVNAVAVPMYFVIVILSSVENSAEMGHASGSLGIELFCTVATAVTSIFAKRRSELLSAQMSTLLNSEKEEKISEKILRCQAEFRIEGLKTRAASGKPVSDTSLDHSGADGSCAGSSRQAVLPRAPESLHSAPAKLVSFIVEAQRISPELPECAGADCLPMNATVWVEGQPRPVALGSLSAGQRILCFDSLSDDVRYADVLDVRKLPEPSGWVDVALADGTELTMTADHPVKVVNPNCPAFGCPSVQAQDLQPGTSAVMVHKVVMKPVLVESVSSSNSARRPSGAEGGRMAVAVRRPEQYSILCAAPSQSGALNVRSVAVGSGFVEESRLVQRNTFLHLTEFQPPCLRRCSSEPLPGEPRRPSSLRPLAAAASGVAASEVPYSSSASSTGSWLSSVEVVIAPRREAASLAGAESPPEQRASGKGLDTLTGVGPSSAASSTNTPAARSRQPAELASLAAFEEERRSRRGEERWQPSPSRSPRQPAREPDTIGPAEASLPSAGSAAHGSEGCRPCFAFQQDPTSCRRGADCRFCHREDGHFLKRVRGRRIYI